MNVELKNYKRHASMSEETECFEATIYADGKMVGQVHNTGKGGPNMYYWQSPEYREAIEAYLETLPAVEPHAEDPEWLKKMGPQKLDLDGFVDTLCGELELRAQIKRWTRKAVVFRLVGDKRGTYRTVPIKAEAHRQLAVEAIRTKHGADLAEVHS